VIRQIRLSRLSRSIRFARR